MKKYKITVETWGKSGIGTFSAMVYPPFELPVEAARRSIARRTGLTICGRPLIGEGGIYDVTLGRGSCWNGYSVEGRLFFRILD